MITLVFVALVHAKRDQLKNTQVDLDPSWHSTHTADFSDLVTFLVDPQNDLSFYQDLSKDCSL